MLAVLFHWKPDVYVFGLTLKIYAKLDTTSKHELGKWVPYNRTKWSCTIIIISRRR